MWLFISVGLVYKTLEYIRRVETLSDSELGFWRILLGTNSAFAPGNKKRSIAIYRFVVQAQWPLLAASVIFEVVCFSCLFCSKVHLQKKVISILSYAVLVLPILACLMRLALHLKYDITRYKNLEPRAPVMKKVEEDQEFVNADARLQGAKYALAKAQEEDKTAGQNNAEKPDGTSDKFKLVFNKFAKTKFAKTCEKNLGKLSDMVNTSGVAETCKKKFVSVFTRTKGNQKPIQISASRSAVSYHKHSDEDHVKDKSEEIQKKCDEEFEKCLAKEVADKSAIDHISKEWSSERGSSIPQNVSKTRMKDLSQYHLLLGG